MKKSIGYSLMGVGLVGTVLSCLTMDTDIKTSAVIALAVFLFLGFFGCVTVSVAEKRDALSGPRKVYRDTHYLPDMPNKDRVWKEWKRNCNLTNKAKIGWTMKWE